MKKAVYINGIAAISPQHTFETAEFLPDPINYDDNYLLVLDADYKKYINPVQIRRMSRILKISYTCAKNCMQDAAITSLDAIITGTGYGCIDDTEKFLLSMLHQNEQMLNPTAFMQSTHNSVSGIIALNMKSNAYNYTYVHRGLSFESSMIDAMIHIQEGKKNILIGGFEENSKNHFEVTNKISFWKKNHIPSLALLEDKNIGTIAGEGANFFVLSADKTPNTYASVLDVSMLYKPKSYEEVAATIQLLLDKNNIAAADIDVYVSGLNGDSTMDSIYYEVADKLIPAASLLYFKHLCGEYYTAASFGLWVASMILKRQEIPAILQVHKQEKKQIKYILLHNHYRNINHGFYLLKHE
ncbi:MAG: beta-ketoacyl synthase chain length factor [Bacteroidota bacterium]